ncbi:MAG: TIGR03557 family F420-dependent LLM class oxidoreductase [Acidimicrobiia bacterium]
MTQYGLTLSSEEHTPRHLVEMATTAEQAGFDFVSISDHFHPWITAQGHSPFVWSVLGAIAEATEHVEVGVGVSCPTFRLNPVVSAQAAATTACLLPDRFTWGVGSGEALNEHVTGEPWPTAQVRLSMLEEAIDVIRDLWTGESITHRGNHYTVEDARLFDLPENPPPLVVSAFADDSARLAAQKGDGLWTSGANGEVIDVFRGAGGEGPVWAQLTVCWDPDEEKARRRAHEIWPNTALPGQLAQDLRTVLHFEQAVKLVSEDDVAAEVPCGPEADPILERMGEMEKVGVDHIYLHQIGDPTSGFIDFWEQELRPAL